MFSAHEIREVCQAGKDRDPRAPRRGTGPLVALLLLGLLAGTASAGTYYVDASSPQCSPTGPGTVSQPYCTISAALAAHGSAGNTILVQPGTYRETVTFAASGTSLAPVVLRATPASSNFTNFGSSCSLSIAAHACGSASTRDP